MGQIERRVTMGDEHPELNVSRCTFQINYVARISGISKRRLESVFIQGLRMRPGVNWVTFYDAFIAYLEKEPSNEVDLTKARTLTDECVGDNGHFKSPEGKNTQKGKKSNPDVGRSTQRH